MYGARVSRISYPGGGGGRITVSSSESESVKSISFGSGGLYVGLYIVICNLRRLRARTFFPSRCLRLYLLAA